jgi:tetratricopeptide (TPR) repeat protein
MQTQLPSSLPAELVAAVAEGRAVLFLGAGASRGAKDANGNEIPLASQLAEKLIATFLGPPYAGLDFRTAYDLSCSQRDVRTVQRFLFDQLSPFHPAAFHERIPTIPWAGLLTTNYDLIIERAYSKARSPVQKLVPNVRDDDGSADLLDYRSVLYVKLHGCITRYHEVHPPLVASTEQLIAFRNGRNGQFDTFLEWAKTKTLIFAGYSFLDNNLRSLFAEIIKEGDNRPRHYIVNRGLLEAEQTYWSDRRVTAINMTFEDFVVKLDQTIPIGKRSLGQLASHTLHTSSFTRFITVPGRLETDDLRSYFASLIHQVSSAVVAPADDPRKFYRGFDLGWFPIQAELDVHRAITNEVLSEQIIQTPPAERASFVIIKGHAGSGKSVTLRRIAWEAATRHERLCFLVSRHGLLDPKRFEEIFSLTNLPIYLFIDNVSEHKDRILELLGLIRKMRAAVRIIGTESFSIWNTSCDDLEPFVSSEYEMRYLSESAIKELVSKLDAHNSLGYLESLTPELRYEQLRQIHGRQLLVALLEATHGVPLIDIIANEHQSIPTPEARILYLDICSLHRFGPPVRAGLISRLHDISFDEFEERLFKPLEQIVHLRRDPKSGDYVYEARHSHIANVVYEAALKTQEERFDNLVRIVTKLNPTFSYDLEVLARLVKADNILTAIPDPFRGRQLYDAALSAAGRRVVILHQRGIYEMHVASNFAELERAAKFISEALEIEPHNPSIKHSLAELDLKRSRMSVDIFARRTWRQSAIAQASALAANSRNCYPHTTLVKAAIDDVRDALSIAEADNIEASNLSLGDSIAKAEEVLKRALQSFPNDPVLFGMEGELSSTLAQAERAETAFRRAFLANPRSTLIARRLARILRSNRNFADALTILRQSIEANPSSRELHYDIATTMMESACDGDQVFSDDVLYHLHRSFAPGDRNHQAQFLYARQLCLANRYGEAVPIFARLKELRIPFREKVGVAGVIQDSNCKSRRFEGSILNAQSAYSFIECETPRMRVYAAAGELPETAELVPGVIVSFEVGFNLLGPVGLKVELVK